MSIKLSLTAAAVSILLCGHAGAAVVITKWNTGNVSVSTPSADVAGESVIYDRSPVSAGARTSGKVTFDGSESDSPGLKVVNDAPLTGSNGDVFNCVMANSPAFCNSEKQSGKRFKFRRTGHEATDMVFDVDPKGEFEPPTDLQPKVNDGLYKFFSAFGNDTGGRLSSFAVSLGTGVGADFVPSGDDGLSFKQTFGGEEPKPNQFSALFANGLFGDIDDVHKITGYFSIDRAGFNMTFDGADRFASTGLFGDYAPLFGPMLSSQQLPLGFFFDDDGDAETDNVLIAHQLADGTWRQNRAIDASGLVTTIAYGNGGTFYATEDALIAVLSSTFALCSDVTTTGTKCLAGSGAIDDLAKFNLTFFVDPTGYAGEDFTLRIESVPEPGSLALAGLALGGLGALRRRRRG